MNTRQLESLDDRYKTLLACGASWYPPEIQERRWLRWQKLLERANLQIGRSVEMGSGTGTLSIRLARLGWLAFGFEASEHAVEEANSIAAQENLRASFICANLADPIPVPVLDCISGSFQLAIDADCYHYIHGESRTVFLENIARVLEPGGCLLGCTCVGQPPEENWDMLGYIQSTRICYHGEVPMTYCAEWQEVLDELQIAGFQVEHAEVYSEPSYSSPACLEYIARIPRQSLGRTETQKRPDSAV